MAIKPYAERSIPIPKSITIRDLMTWVPLIHIDDKLMQRMFNQWPPDRVDLFLVALYEGTGRATPLVLADVDAVLKSLIDIKENEGTSESIEKSIEVFQDIKDKGRKYVLLDGQHRFKHLVKWIQPSTEEERYYPESDELNKLFADTDGKRPKFEQIAEQAFCDLDESVKNYFLDAKLPVIMFVEGHLRIIQKAFKVVNSSTMPEKMSIRMISMAPVVEFIRDLINPVAKIGNIEIRRFLSNILSGEKATDKIETKSGFEKMIATSIGWLNKSKYSNWSDDSGLDAICDYTSKVSSTSLSQVNNIWSIISNGFVNKYDLTNRKKVIKVIPGQNSNWSNVLNFFVFTHSIVYGSLKSLKDISKCVYINNPILYTEELVRMVQTITAETAYIYVDKKGDVTPDISKAIKIKNPITNKLEPKIATIQTKVGSKIQEDKLSNRHGFGGHNAGTDTRKLNLRLEMMEAYFEKVKEDWIRRGIINYVDSNRSIDNIESLYNAVVIQNYQDSYLDEEFSPIQLAEGTNLSDNHFGKNFVEGGSTTLVGNAIVNKKLGKKKIAPAE
jgi:hypothetical protein